MLPNSCILWQEPCFSAAFCRKLRPLSSCCRLDPVCGSIKGSAALTQHPTHSSATCRRHLHTPEKEAPFCCLDILQGNSPGGGAYQDMEA